MLWFAFFLALFHLPSNADADDAVIENYTKVEKNARQIKHDNDRLQDTKHKSTKHKHRKQNKTSSESKPAEVIDNLYVSPYLVKDDVNLKKYAVHLFKRTTRLFDRVGEASGNRTLAHVVAHHYKKKFTQYLRVLQNRKIKTSLGHQKVIMNILDTSNLILRRCLDYLVHHTEEKTVLRADEYGVKHIVKREIEHVMESEYKYICSKHNICRAGYGFLDFLSEAVNELLKNNNRKLKAASDSMTESMRNAELKKVLDVDLKYKYMAAIGRVERWDDETLRFTLQILKSMLIMRNQPFQLPPSMKNQHLDKVVALMDMFNTLNEVFIPSEENRREWHNMKEALQDYTKGERHDIQRITNAFVEHLTGGIYYLDPATAHKLKGQLRIILS